MMETEATQELAMPAICHEQREQIAANPASGQEKSAEPEPLGLSGNPPDKPLNQHDPERKREAAYVLTRDPDVVASVQRNELHDVIGVMRPDGFALCYRWSVDRWRAHAARAALLASGEQP